MLFPCSIVVDVLGAQLEVRTKRRTKIAKVAKAFCKHTQREVTEVRVIVLLSTATVCRMVG